MGEVDPLLARVEMPSEPRGSPGVSEVQSPSLPDICIGCGMHHGSVGAELGCLRLALTAAREVKKIYEGG